MSAPSGVCVLYVLIWHLMGSAGCRSARLKSQSAKRPHATESTPSSAPSLSVAPLVRPPWASLRSGARLDLRLVDAARLYRFKLSTVPQHGMHDDGETTGERHLGLAHCHRHRSTWNAGS